MFLHQFTKNEYAEEPPKDYCCPITTEIMADPVMTADGHSYERSAINDWLIENNTSPLTGEELEHKQVIPNRTLKKAIQSFVEKNQAIYQQQFISAMEKSDYNTILHLEKLGVDIKACDRNGWTILHHAAFEGDEEKISHWLAKGIDKDVNSANISSLDLSRVKTQGLAEEIKSLNEKISEIEHQEKYFDSIVKEGEKHYENWSRNFNTYRKKLNEYSENRKKLEEMRVNLSEIKKQLSVKNYEYSTEGKISFSQLSPLHLAICQGHASIIKMLLNNGANIEAKAKVTDIGSGQKENDITPLFLAIYHNNLELIKLLVSYGASVDAIDKEHGTVFHACARFADEPIIDYFLILGVNVQIRNPAAIATYYRRPEIAKYLIEKAQEKVVDVPQIVSLVDHGKRIEMLERQVEFLTKQLAILLTNNTLPSSSLASFSQSPKPAPARLGIFDNQGTKPKPSPVAKKSIQEDPTVNRKVN